MEEGAPSPAGENNDVYAAQQQIIIDVLESHGGAAIGVIQQALKRELTDRQVPSPPPQWIEMVAEEISRDRLYVVANGLVPRDQFSNPSAAHPS
ncbi:hypothetical protein GCM10009841_02180 [Microlunatus panaciterrae]|uniref:Uncharacterized protein n=1 Tax=Microlunatus panaciterrae TaxID=400768 RepID=A0ABS2RKV1_9ACTN|nr:hypothetical protein [Microlunatus panaciterrae]MBM7799117.1 hypothetical protein [Microlunatus panaciterrae]